MITMQNLQDKLLNLISKSNRHTGKNDTDLTEAIDSLIAMKEADEETIRVPIFDTSELASKGILGIS